MLCALCARGCATHRDARVPASDGDHPSLGVGGVGVDGVSPRVGSARGDQRHTTCLLGGSSHGPILTLTLSNSTTLTLTSTLTLTNSGSQADLEEGVSFMRPCC